MNGCLLMGIRQFEKKKPLNSGLNDFIITLIDFDEEPKKLASFCVLQVYCTGGENHEIIKFDTAHGFCHVHRYYRNLQDKGEKLIGKEISQKAFDECREDIKCNWRKYRKWFISKWLK